MAPEFAEALGLLNLAGTDVGNTRIDAIIDDGDILDTPFIRFQNSNFPGNYLYATASEIDDIYSKFTNFIDEGVAFEVEI